MNLKKENELILNYGVSEKIKKLQKEKKLKKS